MVDVIILYILVLNGFPVLILAIPILIVLVILLIINTYLVAILIILGRDYLNMLIDGRNLLILILMAGPFLGKELCPACLLFQCLLIGWRAHILLHES